MGVTHKGHGRSFDQINFPYASQHEIVKIKDLTPFPSIAYFEPLADTPS
jgi:hypothetical protein